MMFNFEKTKFETLLFVFFIKIKVLICT